MSLPVIPKKQFEVKSKHLPNGKISLIPFTVGLESLLIEVKESEDDAEKMQIIKQIVQACIQTKNVDVEAIPIFLIEEIFLRLRQKSVGELIDQSYKCTNEFEGAECNTVMPIQINLEDFKIIEPEGHTNVIVISDPIGIKFKYPTMSMAEELASGNDTETIISCIDSIFDNENVWPAADQTREELTDFWNQLTLPQKKDVFDKFFLTIPHMHYKKSLVCTKCKHDHTIEFKSVSEVFQ